MKVYEGVEIGCHILLTSAPDGSVRSASCSGRFTPRKMGHSVNWTEGCLNSRASVDAAEIANNLHPSVAQLSGQQTVAVLAELSRFLYSMYYVYYLYLYHYNVFWSFIVVIVYIIK
jgi:hypothetical protein